MLFNSLRYMVFFPTAVLLYYLCPKRYRWALLLAASYYFYMCWEAKYLLLIIASTLIDYVAGILMGRTEAPGKRLALLLLSLLTNLGLLFTFKYFAFFSESLRAALAPFNIFIDVPAFKPLLPVGISFYTFQTLSYTIDVFRRQREPETHLGIFAVYVAFFPQLVAGPIERSQRLLPQFYEDHAPQWDRMIDGLQLIVWGLFKKIVVADRLSVFVDQVFEHAGTYHGAPVWLAAYFFSFQIYCDFSGYSDIAIGSAQIMGFRLMDNFRQPYLARDIGDFWKRWHISLSTWFRDYLYIPLGGNRVPALRWHLNLLIVFVVSGLWHGANWTFVIWGGLHGTYYIASRWTSGLRESVARAVGFNRIPACRAIVQTLITFHLVTLAYIFFRANSLSDAVRLIQGLFLFTPDHPIRVALTPTDFAVALLSVVFLMTMEGLPALRRAERGRSLLAERPGWLRFAFYYAITMSIFIFGRFGSNPFIYFQF